MATKKATAAAKVEISKPAAAPAAKAPAPAQHQKGASQHDAATISARAYQLWLEGGRAHGHDRDHWFQAEAELRGSTRA